MIMAAELGRLPAAQQERLTDLVRRAGLPTAPPAVAAAKLRDAMGMDKKIKG